MYYGSFNDHILLQDGCKLLDLWTKPVKPNADRPFNTSVVWICVDTPSDLVTLT